MTPQQIELALETIALVLEDLKKTQEKQQAIITTLEEALKEHAMRKVQRLGQEIEEPWCMKMNGCKTKCEDCPDEPPQRTEQEPVAWPCHIIEADFSERTITLVMQCKDYKVSAGTHWLSTTQPKEKNT